MTLNLIYREDTTILVEHVGLSPEWACNKSLAEIERFEILPGNQSLVLADPIRASGDASAEVPHA